MRTRFVTLTVVAVPAAAASLAIAVCGGSAASAASTPVAGPSGMPQAGQDMSVVVSDVLDALVGDGTITSAQRAAAVEALSRGPQDGMPQASPSAGAPGPQASPLPPGKDPATKAQAPGGDDLVATVLTPLVEDGTITEAQSEAIAQAVADALPDIPGARSPPRDAAQA